MFFLKNTFSFERNFRATFSREWQYCKIMTSNENRAAEREALRSVIQQWNANRLDLFELSEPDEVIINFFFLLQIKIKIQIENNHSLICLQNLQFHGVMRFYFQDRGQKVATKCIRVASDATVTDVIGKT